MIILQVSGLITRIFAVNKLMVEFTSKFPVYVFSSRHSLEHVFWVILHYRVWFSDLALHERVRFWRPCPHSIPPLTWQLTPEGLITTRVASFYIYYAWKCVKKSNVTVKVLVLWSLCSIMIISALPKRLNEAPGLRLG